MANAQSVFDEADWFVVWAQDLWGINDVEALDNYTAAADKLKTVFEKLP